MLKYYLLLILANLIFNNLIAQDLIVTNDNDSINCKITDLKNDYIYFTFKYDKEIRSTLIPRNEVLSFNYDYYKISEIPADKVIGVENYDHFSLSVNGGYSYLTAKISDKVPSDFEDYIKELKSGYHFGADIKYYFSENIGIGIKYNQFKSSNSLDNIYVEDTSGNRRYGKMSDNITTFYIGPEFSTRLPNQNKTGIFYSDFSLGYIGHTNNFVIVDNYTMKGNSLAYILNIGYDIKISENFFAGFQISYTAGFLTEYELDNGNTKQVVELESDEYESLNRLDLSLCFRFSK